MDRLRDLKQSPERDVANAAELISTMRPMSSTPSLEVRLRERLGTNAPVPTGLLSQVAMGSCVVAGLALAGVGVRSWLAKPAQTLSAIVAPVPAATAPAAPAPVSAPEPGPAPAPSSAVAVAANPLPTPSVSTAPKPTRSSKHHDTGSAGFDLDGPDAQLVISAVQALRQEHDPAKADGLLVDYLRLHPTGALREEVLALRIEAAAKRNDSQAAQLAEQYLQQFPTGRYAEAARRAKVRFAK